MIRKSASEIKVQLEYCDRKTLRVLRQRFKKINDGRLIRASQGLNANQRTFFQSLAVLLHINHPLLPGYINKDTPATISHFNPSQLNLRAIKTLFKSFAYKPTPPFDPDIFSVFLMGSTGSVAHAGGSDMDIWVCYNPDLPVDRLNLLNQKLHQITVWAKKEVALDIYFFPMNADAFRQGLHTSQLNNEDSGSAQHYLLLDEFYRTGLLLEGRYPMWWLISPEIEHEYAAYVNFILNRKFIEEDEAIDFGNMISIPAGEFIGAGIWQLYKAIDSPYKSLVKILLTEAYAAQYPNVELVSMNFKQLIHQGVEDLDRVDPYLMVFNTIESYLLKSKDYARLTLAQQCFYLKTKVEVSKIKSTETNWRKLLMKNIVGQWQWQADDLVQLDNRKSWDIFDVNARKKALVREMNMSYRFLLSFAKRHRSEVTINTSDITLLGRKLHAAFEKKRGKIERANPNIAPDITEQAFTIYVDEDISTHSYIWSIYAGSLSQIDRKIQNPLKRSRSFVEPLAWTYFNEIYFSGTHLNIHAPNTQIGVVDAAQVYDLLGKHFPKRHQSAEMNAFQEVAQTQLIVLFVEYGNPRKYLANFEKNFNQDDPLNQATDPASAVNCLDCISVNSWQEITCLHYDESEGIIQCLVQLLIDMPPAEHDITLIVESGMKYHNEIVKLRMETLVQEFFFCFQKHKFAASARFVVQIGLQIYGIQSKSEQVYTKKFKSTHALNLWLSEPQKDFSPIIFENKTLSNHKLKLAARYNTPQTIQIFYEVNSNTVEVIIFDEKGSLFSYEADFSSDQYFIAHTFRFLRAIIERQELTQMEAFNHDIGRDEIEFYEIFNDFRKRQLVATKQDIFQHIEQEGFAEVIALLDQTNAGETTYRIFCDDIEFSQLNFGSNLYIAVAKHIMSLREQPSTYYPCYLTDIDLNGLKITHSASASLQVSQYLTYKLQIENSINTALRSLYL